MGEEGEREEWIKEVEEEREREREEGRSDRRKNGRGRNMRGECEVER